MERDVVEPIALLVGKEDHGIFLPVLSQHEGGAFLLTPVGSTALHDGIDGHVALRLKP